MRESAVVKKIVKLVRDRGGWIVKIHGSAFQPKVIDLLACYRGRFVGVEAKALGTSRGTTPLQDKTLRDISVAGGVSLVARSADEVKIQLDLIDAAGGWQVVDERAASVYVIFDERIEKAQKSLGRSMKKLTVDEVVEIATMIGLGPCISWGKNERSIKLNFDYDVQVVAFAAAMAAVVELRDNYEI